MPKGLPGISAPEVTGLGTPLPQNRADFINLVMAFDTDDPLEAVIAQLQAAETLCGRRRDAPKWAPRAMDLDILLYGSAILQQPGLTLPRPDLLRRAYMLGPAAEVLGEHA